MQNAESSVSWHRDSQADWPRNRPPPEKVASVHGPEPVNPEGGARSNPSSSGLAPTWTTKPPLMLGATTRTKVSLGGINHSEAGGMMPSMTAVHRPSPRVPASSARRSGGPSSQPSFVSRPTPTSILGRPTPSFGSWITTWHASWAVWMMTCSSSVIFCYSWQTNPELWLARAPP